MTNQSPSKLLLVESIDDQHVVQSVYERCYRRQPPFSISNRGSWEAVRAAISPEIKVGGRIALGILVDANDYPTQRWQAIAERVEQAITEVDGHAAALGADADPMGTVVGTGLRVGIWLMPNNGSDGELEDFIKELIPSGDPVWPESEQYIAGIPEAARQFLPNKVQRAKVHAWLAARKEPRRMGEAIGDLDATAPLAKQLSAWLGRLFG